LSRPIGVTPVVVPVIANLSSGEKKIEHKIERFYPRDDPQFLRSMGLPLGPTVVGRNRFDLLMNGKQILPSIMEGIHSARRTTVSKLHLPGSAESACRSRVRCWTSKMDKRYLRMLRERILGRVAGFARCEGQ